MTRDEAKSKLCFALDVNTAEDAMCWVQELSPYIGVFKVGLELFCSCGPNIVRWTSDLTDVFLDLKFYDTPETMRRAAAAVAPLRPKFLTVHIEAGRKALVGVKGELTETKVLGVTRLTSGDVVDVSEVIDLAGRAYVAGLDGVVAAGWETV